MRWVAMLRGVNVGGTTVSMVDLRRALAAAGLGEVTTYRQSGNVIASSDLDATGVEDAVATSVAEVSGHDVAVVARSADELGTVVAVNPLSARSVDPTRLHVTFLRHPPAPGRLGSLTLPPTGDEMVVVEREVYLHCPGGYGRTPLTTGWIERSLGVVATTRNWRTVTRLAELAAGA